MKEKRTFTKEQKLQILKETSEKVIKRPSERQI
jgi:hypothetical protein